MAFGEVLIREFTDETDVFLDDFTFLFHLLYAVFAALLLQSLQDVLILLDDLHQFSLAVGLIQRFLLILAEVLIEPRVGCLAAFGFDRLYLLEKGLVLAIDLDVSHLLEGDLLGTLV